jgi:hypothetical protein
MLRLAEVATILERELQDRPVPEVSVPLRRRIKWALANKEKLSCQSTDVEIRAQSPRLRVAAAMSAVSSAAAAVKRKSFGGADATPSKRRKSITSARELHDLGEDEFLSDVHSTCIGPKDLPAQYLCPISWDVMRDPVVVSGSGNTYDRKSIERHFQTKHTDPITNGELRRTSERRLVPNNALKSQVLQAEQEVVDLRLVAFLGEQSDSLASGEGGMGHFLWKKLLGSG